MNRKLKYAAIGTVFVAMFVLLAPHAALASSRGIFMDIYCGLLSIVDKQCEVEVAGVKVQI